jgi:DNA-binding transcriptional MerR regulator
MPRPEMRGRVAYYGPAHVARLELIAQLQDRGLRIDAIRDVVTRIERGELDVGEWLGLQAELAAPWANDQPRTVTEDELVRMVGGRRPGMIGDLVRAGLVERHGDTYLVRSPALVALAARLEAAGVDPDTSFRANEILRKHLGRAATELRDLFVERLGDDAGEPDLPTVLETLRPTALDAVRVIFAQEMERGLRELLSSGRSARLPLRRGRRRR